MSLSLTYQQLPESLLQPVLDGHLTLAEATWLFDEWLLTPEGEIRELPEPLWPVAQRLHLLEMEVEPTRH